MSAPEPPTPPPASGSSPTPSTSPSVSSATNATPASNPSSSSVAANKPSPPEPPKPLTGFRASLEHTGIPRSVLLWKPRLPSRNWCIFWSVLGTVSYLYWDDRRQCAAIKEEYIAKAKQYGQQPLQGGGLGEVRKVKVYAARWPDDDDTDRGARYFRKYIKPYLVAAAIDYSTMPAPLYGSITRQIHAEVLAKRRQSLGLEPPPVALSLPGAMDPAGAAQRELEGGSIIVGRASLKEYLEGLRRGWEGGVGKWDWEEEVRDKVEKDRFFDIKETTIRQGAGLDLDSMNEAELVAAAEKRAAEVGASGTVSSTLTPTTSSPSPSSVSGLAFLSKPRLPQPVISQSPTGEIVENIPPQLHATPSPLPPQPPLLLVPWENALGFKQIPKHIYDFFTERYRVREGAELAWALIRGETRPFVGSAPEDVAVDSLKDVADAKIAPTSSTSKSNSDLSFDQAVESTYRPAFAALPATFQKAREEYYVELQKKLDDLRALARGERELTKEEAKSGKPLTTEDDLKKERFKKELRWKGMEEGWGIVRPEEGVKWSAEKEGWLKVFKKEGE